MDSYGFSCADNAGVCYNGWFDDDDFDEMSMCCACGGGQVESPHVTEIPWEDESAPMDGITATWEGGVSEAGGSVYFAWSRGGWNMDSADWDGKLNCATLNQGHL